MRVDHSVISRHLQNLEAQLKVKLVRQEGRGLALTSVGARYHERISKAFDEIASATAELSSATTNLFEIYSTPGFAHRVLLPALPDLQALLPDWSIILHAFSNAADRQSEGVRVEVFFSDRPPPRPGMACECFSRPRLFPVINPRISVSWLGVREPSELLQLPIIHAEAEGLWLEWFRRVGYENVPRLKGPRLQNTHLALEAAKFGQGVALANQILVKEDLVSGELVELFESDVHAGGYHVASPQSLWDGEAVSVCRAWLRQIVADRV